MHFDGNSAVYTKGRRRTQVVRGIRTQDGRRLTVEEYGDPDGTPVVLLHDTPGCRFGVVPREIVAERAHIGSSPTTAPSTAIRTVCRDAVCPTPPGTWRSRPAPSGSAAPAVPRTPWLAPRCCPPGYGGRRPASPAPPDARDLSWFDGMAGSDVEEFTRALTDPLTFAGSRHAARAAVARRPGQVLPGGPLRSAGRPPCRTGLALRTTATDHVVITANPRTADAYGGPPGAGCDAGRCGPRRR